MSWASAPEGRSQGGGPGPFALSKPQMRVPPVPRSWGPGRLWTSISRKKPAPFQSRVCTVPPFKRLTAGWKWEKCRLFERNVWLYHDFLEEMSGFFHTFYSKSRPRRECLPIARHFSSKMPAHNHTESWLRCGTRVPLNFVGLNQDIRRSLRAGLLAGDPGVDAGFQHVQRQGSGVQNLVVEGADVELVAKRLLRAFA